MSESFVVQSSTGPYSVAFDESDRFDAGRLLDGTPHFLVDENVARLHGDALADVLAHPNTILVHATEPNKSIAAVIPIYERLVAANVRRGQPLIAIGGGITQDIACFIASTLLRGLPWRFVPTTLLAQADSCIGSKSSINLGATKNIIGTFYPPRDVIVNTRFLDTLDETEMRSGIGEILKVHAIDGAATFDALSADFDRLLTDRAVLQRYTLAALLIKRRFIEIDEFDRGVRNIFNYGHSFGHAIESATRYTIPHGIAVSMGMDLANHVAVSRGVLPSRHAARMHGALRRNYQLLAATPIPREPLFAALLKDKKNTASMLGLILPVGDDASIQRVEVPPDEAFRRQCDDFLTALAS